MNIYLTPGPTEIHPIVKQALRHAIDSEIASISHRSKEFENLLFHTESELRRCLIVPKDYRVFFVSSGTECWERVIQNGVEQNSLHFVNGAFSKRFFETAQELGKSPSSIENVLGKGFELSDVPTHSPSELICITQNETSTGVSLTEGFIGNLRKQNKNSLIAVDAVSCAPYADINLTDVDYYFFSVQKFFCMPAGLGVLIVSPNAIDKATQLQKNNFSIGAHHSLLSLDHFAQKHQTPCTPNTVMIYALGEIVKHLNSEGMDIVRRKTREKSDLLYKQLDNSKKYQPYIQNKLWRSATVITIQTGEHTKKITQQLKENKLIVGEGYGPLKDQQIRVANFSAHSLKEFKKLCEILQ